MYIHALQVLIFSKTSPYSVLKYSTFWHMKWLVKELCMPVCMLNYQDKSLKGSFLVHSLKWKAMIQVAFTIRK